MYKLTEITLDNPIDDYSAKAYVPYFITVPFMERTSNQY